MKTLRSISPFILCVICTLVLAACGSMTEPAAIAAGAPPQPKVNPATINPKNLETATFAGGCFWSMQRMMDEVPGVITTTVGYSGGTVANPTYEQVSSETTGHAESVQVIFDTAEITYTTLVMNYWHMIDPTQTDQQACDVGSSYRSIIFYNSPAQQMIAETSKKALESSGRFSQPIVTTIEASMPFYPAEDYHQKYYLKNPENYAAYRVGCGRDERLVAIWGSAPQ